jgi:hypothetical protein
MGALMLSLPNPPDAFGLALLALPAGALTYFGIAAIRIIAAVVYGFIDGRLSR